MAGKDGTNIFTFTQLRKERMLQNFEKSQLQSTERNRRKRNPGAARPQVRVCFSPSAVRPYLFPIGCKWLCRLCPSRGCFIFALHCKSSQQTRFLSCQALLNAISLALPSCIFPVLLLKSGLLLNSLCGYTVTHFS